MLYIKAGILVVKLTDGYFILARELAFYKEKLEFLLLSCVLILVSSMCMLKLEDLVYHSFEFGNIAYPSPPILHQLSYTNFRNAIF